jgi:hypothetical protein
MLKEAVEATKAAEKNSERVAQFNAQVIGLAKTEAGDIEVGNRKAPAIGKAFSVWQWFAGNEKPAKAVMSKDNAVEAEWSDIEAKPGAWRIKEFLGCQVPNWGDGTKPASYAGLTVPGGPDVLVIDDLGLGFAYHSEAWPSYLTGDAKSSPPCIVAKLTPPLDGPLWKKLLTPNWASKVTLVMTATSLRAVGARLSHAFSWDQTIEEVKAEFESGGVCWPLRYCRRVVVTFGRSGAAVFSREPRSPLEVRKPPAVLQFERFVFDPAYLEGAWSSEVQGITFGATSVMTAMLAVQMLATPQPSSHLPVSRGLAAARELHRIGGGYDKSGFELGAADSRVFAFATKAHSEEIFRSAFCRDLLDDPATEETAEIPPLERQTLLTDALGLTSAFLTLAAQNIVKFGKEIALQSIPHLKIGKYFTVDREEIERMNTVRNLILDYQMSAETRPLSIAVFGPPGVGKSFAIKELSEVLFGKDLLEFNLSQFEELDVLHEAFHEVRSQSVKGQMPLAFWDEFDSMRGSIRFGWLKEFLAPMQDGKFVAHGRVHPFGKCIFIFAGGTSSTYEEFIRPIDPEYQPNRKEEEAHMKNRAHFKEVKGSDFVSRLRGYLNIKGLGLTSPKSDESKSTAPRQADETSVIRRALLLRSLIEKHHKTAFQPRKELIISPTVLDAFLTVKEYRHGARSMEAIVSLSQIAKSRSFGPSELPGREVVELHASSDFLAIVEDRSRYHLSFSDFERVAELTHERWREAKASNKQITDPNVPGKRIIKRGYIYGPVRNDSADPPTHPLMLPYAKLTREQKDLNRLPARAIALRLGTLGFEICARDQTNGRPVVRQLKLPLERLARSEHRRWMVEKLLTGFAYAPKTIDDRLLQADICKFDQLPHWEASLDDAIVESIFLFLNERDLVLVKRKHTRQRVKHTRKALPVSKKRSPPPNR